LDDLSQRVSDAEREQAVASLREHLLAGRLTLDEFSERVELAYRAKVGHELAEVAAGLPAPPQGSRRRRTRLTAAVFGKTTRRGRLRLGRSTAAVSVFADIDLDLRQAEIDDPETTITALAVFGNIDVYVPEGVNVDVQGLTVFGRRREWGRDIAPRDAPTIQIRVLGVFGTIDVWRVPPQMTGSYGEIFKQLQQQQRELPAR
jgi:hypothetical protein